MLSQAAAQMLHIIYFSWNLGKNNCYIINNLLSPEAIWHTKCLVFFLSLVIWPCSHTLSSWYKFRVPYKCNSSSQIWWDTEINCSVPWTVTLNNQAFSFPMGIMWLHSQRIIFTYSFMVFPTEETTLLSHFKDY